MYLGNGPCVASLDVTLNNIGIERQAYHGKKLYRESLS